MPNLYGHHRQTSIVNGIQHSRNGSYADAPLSPAIIAAAGAQMGREGDETAATGSKMMKQELGGSASNSNSSLNTLGGYGSTFSTASTLKPERGAIPQSEGSGLQRMERMHSNSSRPKREHSRHQSHSRQTSQARPHRENAKPVGEYALHVLFNSFIAQADDKIAQCITTPLEPEPQIERIAGKGVDANFDQLIEALGHIAKPKPKSLIDSLMLWRKRKSDEAAIARQHLQQYRFQGAGPYGALPRRNTEPDNPSAALNAPAFHQPSLAQMQISVAQAERRSTVSIYILCRVLTEIISQSSLARLTPDMADKLEGIIFSQLKIADPDSLASSSLKLANWHLFSQFLGVMSNINFASVTKRFKNDLDLALVELDGKGPANRDVEGRTELVLGGMKHLRIKTEPPEAWDQSCDFLLHVSRFFQKSHGRKIKYACCQILDTLLLPIAATGTAQPSTTKWQEFLSTTGNRLASMMAKPGHWPVAFPVTATLLCVSPPEVFCAQWTQLVMPLGSKLKDRLTRASCLQVISRLLWTYLYRCNTDTPRDTYRKLEEVVRLVLPPGKKAHTTDPSIVDPLIEIIRIIGFKHQDFCFRTIIFPLINSELFAHGKDVHSVRVDQLEPEKMVIGIRAFLAIMADLEKGEAGQPPFPQKYSSNLQSDRLPVSPIMSTPRQRLPLPPPNPGADRLSHPVATSMLNDVSRGYYKRFCEILGIITIICDETFGGQAVLDEKFAPPVPKTPIAETFNFSRRDDILSPVEQKHGYYELLHVAVQALPRCLSADIPFNSLINLLCTGTAHVQHKIAESSAQSIKSIARQSHAQQVTIGFARFIFSFDDKYSTMSDGGMLGPTHVENTLKLYVELLEIWISEIKQRTKDAMASSDDVLIDKRMAGLDTSGIWAHVEEVESHGLFFLCSQSRKVRTFAITVLRLIMQFDAALGQEDNIRLIQILEGDSMTIMDLNGENLSVAERSRLQRNMKNDSSQSALIELCSSEVSYDTTLWFKVFPNLMRISFDRCPVVVTLARELICNRILQMYKGVAGLSENMTRHHQYEVSGSRMGLRASTTPPEVMVEQWKLYLIVACTTLTNKGAQLLPAPEMKDHVRKGSKTAGALAQQKINSARTLFRYVLPLLSIGHPLVRDAVVVALGSINKNIYKILLDELQDAVTRCNDDARARIHQRSASSPKRNKKMDTLRTEVTHVYKLTAHFLREKDVCEDDWILNNLVTYAKDLKLFLMDGEIQMDWEFQKLRRHYCGLMEELFEGINRTSDPSRWMTFEMRKSSFALMEDWCGYSPNQEQLQQRENQIREAMIGQQAMGERPMFSATMEKEKNNLKTAALSAMATLCGGPISVTTASNANLQFDIRRMLLWIDTMFNTESDRVHIIGRRALSNLVMHNKEYPYLLEHTISRCYMAEQPKALQSYFEVVTQIIIDNPDYPIPFWRILGIGLYTLGSDLSDIRSKSSTVLRTLEERQARNSKIQDFDISISDKTKAVYKLAQFEISKRLASQHSEVAFLIFSEFTVYFRTLKPMAQQNMVAAILPWIQTIELQVEIASKDPTAQSYVILANLFEITIKSSSALHNEVQALWQALATGPHPGNVKLVLDFIVQLCLDRREQNFVEYSKQIVVFLSSTPAGIKVVDALLMNINFRDMIPHERKKLVAPEDAAAMDLTGMPYVADLGQALPVGTKQAALSLGQLSLILLVDLMVSPVKLDADKVPLLLQAVTMLWDCHTPLVKDQAREMLIHLIHELVISQIPDDEETKTPNKAQIEELIESIRTNDPSIVWGYDDNRGKIHDRDNKLPAGMEHLTTQVASTFELTYPTIKEEWARWSLTWAASCPVFHLACRSFQIFRCISTSLDLAMLGNMLARLSSTIAGDESDHQIFSIEVLTTLKTLISKLAPTDLVTFPQLFWTACACLDTINELEFLESLGMLDELLVKLDLGDPVVGRLLFEGQPPQWEGNFEGLQPLVYKGLRSSTCLDRTIVTINKLVQIPSGDLVGNDNRLLFAVLANFPSFLHAMEQDVIDPAVAETASILAQVADSQGCEAITNTLSALAMSRITSSEFMVQLVAALRDNFFPYFEFQTLKFLMGFLTNSLPWFKLQTMKLLCAIIPEIDMRNPEIAQHGPDMISPLLRLLQTEYCMEALQVLDKVMTMAGTATDEQHLRMSMFGSRTSKSARKEFADIPSLFGIPEDSGWSIPMPAKHQKVTRHNMTVTWHMCDEDDVLTGEGGTTRTGDGGEMEDWGFHNEEENFQYFDFQATGLERADTMQTVMSDDTAFNGHIGDLVSKLDSLDDFFEDTLQSPTSDGRSSRTITEFNGDFEGGAELYEEQTLPILAESLGHQAANSQSFQNGFSDLHSRPQLGSGFSPTGFSTGKFNTEFNSMNPGAFNMPPTMGMGMGNPSHISAGLGRPSMHSRSVTSPSQPSPYPPDFSDDEYGSGVFSDGDEGLSSLSRSAHIPRSDGGARFDGGPPPAFDRENYSDGGFFTGESGGMSGLSQRGVRAVRRLTGGRTRENDRSREVVRAMAGPKSPRVPRVPREYLSQAMPMGMGMQGGGGGGSGTGGREKSPGEAI